MPSVTVDARRRKKTEKNSFLCFNDPCHKLNMLVFAKKHKKKMENTQESSSEFLMEKY